MKATIIHGWEGTPIPEPICLTATVAGNYEKEQKGALYIIGGQNAKGPTDKIWAKYFSTK